MKSALKMGIALLLFGCAHTEIAAPKSPSQTLAGIINQSRTEKFSGTLAVDVYYATNRVSTGDTYGVKAGEALQFGVAKVNVPKRHATGQIDVASDSRADTHKFFRILNQKTFDAESFKKSIQTHSTKEVLVFIHGFNVRFQDAVFRASQIAYDLKFQGPVILFSWPAGADAGFLSGAMVSKTYAANKLNAELSIPVAVEFFKMLGSLGVEIDILVHSMGHQIAIPALNSIAHLEGSNFKLKELVLNAPDFDLHEFLKVSADIKRVADRITLYCSYNDNAMVASETYNGGERLGACEKVDGVDVINVSEVDSPSFGMGLGHGYYSSRAVLTDVAQLMMGIEAENRLFIRKSEPNSTEDYYLRP